MDEFDSSVLTPDIRRTVQFLRSHGFETTDSGDGVTNVEAEMEGAMPFPNVCIRVRNPENLVAEARRLRDVLAASGIEVEPQGPDDEDQGPHIEASYDPSNDIGFVLLLYLDDKRLFGDG